MAKTPSLFNVFDVEAKNATPVTVEAAVRQALKLEDGECYARMERYLTPPGVCGSRAFDQHEAVKILLEFDERNGGNIIRIMKETGMSQLLLWTKLYAVLRRIGFQMQHGRLVGVLEHKTNDDAEDREPGQPDVE